MEPAYTIPLEDITSSYITRELEGLGITHVRFLGEGGEGEWHISVYAFPQEGGCEGRVANTNALPVWEDEDMAEFLDLVAACEGVLNA